MSHRNAPLAYEGRCRLVDRVRVDGLPVAHVARMSMVSRQCVHRWLKRFDEEGYEGLHDRSSRPHFCARQTPPDVEEKVLAARIEHRRGPEWLSRFTGVPARTVTAILQRAGMPRLYQLDPITGQPMRASRTTALRYERERPGELIHVDVKKLGRIPDGGGWKAHGRGKAPKRQKVGFDYLHSAVDDHSRLAYTEILDSETAEACAGFALRAREFFASHGIERIEEVMTDNALAYRTSFAFADALDQIGAKHRLIKPHCPWQNGKVERFHRTLQTEWAYRRVYTTNHQRSQALEPFLHDYNHHRWHHALGGHPPISRVSPT